MVPGYCSARSEERGPNEGLTRGDEYGRRSEGTMHPGYRDTGVSGVYLVFIDE